MRSTPTALDDLLALADWRRRVAALYAEVRRRATHDPCDAWDFWRHEREALYRDHPQSPVPPAERATFRALHFPYQPTLRQEVAVEPDPAPEDTDAADAAPGVPRRVGWIEVDLPAGRRRLALLWLPGYANGLFLPFRDATGGAETYGGGRYLLDGPKSADHGGDPARRTLVVDFNFAYQPSCAFDARWACPLAPRENWLDVPVRAGERLR